MVLETPGFAICLPFKRTRTDVLFLMREQTITELCLLQTGGMGSGQAAPPPYQASQGQQGQHTMQQPSMPMFVAPPPKPQRLLHSEAYLKYIEGLSAECPTVSKWDQALSGETEEKRLEKSTIEVLNNPFSRLFTVTVCLDESVSYAVCFSVFLSLVLMRGSDSCIYSHASCSHASIVLSSNS